MNILFVHQNFPGQFKNLAPALASHGHEVTALHLRKDLDSEVWNGVKLVKYHAPRGSTKGVHPWVSDFETKIIRAEACFRAARKLNDQGYTPDVIVAHHGWGESLFLKNVWPEARLGIYCEFYYSHSSVDMDFDPEFPAGDSDSEACRLYLKNLNNKLHFEKAHAGISPTQWQASTFPVLFRSKITVVHDGIDTEALTPVEKISLTINLDKGGEVKLSKNGEIITFINRNLEPYRGYHQFMRALPELLRNRPNARVMIIGGDSVSYGARPDSEIYGDRSWKQIFADEVKPQMNETDWGRVHFLGKIPYQQFMAMLQISSVHVYLTYPFVLSWSLLEAMSTGCAIVASNTDPVLEVIEHDVTGRLVDFFDKTALVKEISALLDDPAARSRLGAAARKFAQQHYDLNSVCLNQQIAWVEGLASS